MRVAHAAGRCAVISRCSIDRRRWHMACVESRINEETDMARSTLNTTGESNPVVRKGHGTGALGPSDSTDSGSDIVGGPGLNRDDGLPLQRGTTSDPDIDAARRDGGSRHRRRGPRQRQRSLRHGRARRSGSRLDRSRRRNADRAGRRRRRVRSTSPVAEREANDIESDDRPDEDVEASESIEKRRGLNGATGARKR